MKKTQKLELDKSMKVAIAVLFAAMVLDGMVQGMHPVTYEETTFGLLAQDDDAPDVGSDALFAGR